VTEEALAAIEKEVDDAIDDAVAFAEDSPSPKAEDALKHVFYESATHSGARS
jgi:TPP-dependent pyruvate/acetoin dehydrogenase alpha subunit